MKNLLAAIVIMLLGQACKPTDKIQVNKSVSAAIVQGKNVFEITDKLIVLLVEIEGTDHLIIKCPSKDIRMEFVVTSQLASSIDKHGYTVNTYLVQAKDGNIMSMRTALDGNKLAAVWIGDVSSYFYVNILVEYFV